MLRTPYILYLCQGLHIYFIYVKDSIYTISMYVKDSKLPTYARMSAFMESQKPLAFASRNVDSDLQCDAIRWEQFVKRCRLAQLQHDRKGLFKRNCSLC